MNKTKTLSSMLIVLMLMSIYIAAAAQIGNITNLKNVSYAPNYIKWTWQDPNDANFSKVMIYIDGQFKKNVSKGNQSYNATGLDSDTEYTISTHTVDKKGHISPGWVNDSTRTAANVTTDKKPPASVTSLKNITYANSYIDWTWNDPSDTDFAKVMVYINSTFKTNVTRGIKHYNATGLDAGIQYTIGTHTVDNSGNVNTTWKNHTTMTTSLNNTNDTEPPKSITDLKNITYANSYIDWTWNDPSDTDFAKVMVYINGTFKTNVTRGIKHYNATGLDAGIQYTIGTHTVDNSGNVNITWKSHTANTSYSGPKIIVINEPENLNTSIGTSLYFNIKVDQKANITWKVGNDTIKSEDILANKNSSYIFNSSTKGTYDVKVIAKNGNGTDTKNWPVIVRPKTYSTGNRIWDGSKEMNTTYTWNPYSFAGFYYNLDRDQGTEELTIKDIDRTINEGDIIYKTSPTEIYFDYSNFGKYQVIGFMADKYFAGYTSNSTISNNEEISSLSNGQLHKVLMDDDDRRAVYVGSTLTLGEGYVLKMKEVDIGAGSGQIWITLLKDGNEVDNDVITAGETYVYKKKVGNVDDLPIMAIHFDSVFRGRETNAAFIKGVFQISDSYTDIDSGNKYGKMEISGVSKNQITMESRETVGLSAGDTIDLMGNLRIIVADSDTLRFGLSVDRTGIIGTFEARGTIYPVVDEWTPLNFGLDVGGKNVGFYYDIDEDIGTEKLTIKNINGRSIQEGGLIYSTFPQEVSFDYSGFGKYQVIGFMADKYFAGYTANTKPPNPSTSIGAINVISSGQLHKILIDDEDKRTISVGGTLTLAEGYVLRAKDIDQGARTMLLSLLKDGSEIESTPLSAGQTYVYTKKVGSVNDLPIIMVRFDNVFSGKEVSAAFLKGVFQISDSYTEINSGDTFGKMEISEASKDQITMKNKDDISLSSGSTIDIMGNIKFRVADSGTVRFYPYVLVTPDMVMNQLVINAPSKAVAGDNIDINVTAGGIPIEDVSISIEPEIGLIGNKTNQKGVVNFTLPITSKGKYTIMATKLGYQKANKTIDIEKFIESRLNINIPSQADQFETISIQITSNNTLVSGVKITYDNDTIGLTDSNGTFNYTLESSGTHVISASKSGYITVSRDIDVRMPYSEFKALDINATPDIVFIGDITIIRSNITNVGTKNDSLPIVLIINDTKIDNKTVTLPSKETKEINFTYKVSLPKGNYTVKILEQEKLLEVKEKPLNILLIAGIITIIGIVIIYMLTGKDKIVELIERYKIWGKKK